MTNQPGTKFASPLDVASPILIAVSLGYLTGSFFSGQAYDRFPDYKFLATRSQIM